MKDFITALLLMVVLLGFSVGNLLCLSDAMNELSGDLEHAVTCPAEERASALDRFSSAWEGRRLLFYLSVNRNEFDRLDSALARTEALAENGSDEQYRIAAADLCAALENVRRFTEVSLSGIF